MISIKVFSDYVCPFCLLGEQVLARAIADKDVSVEWMPFELRPYPTPTLRPEGEYLQTTWARSVYPMAAALNVPMVLPKVSPQPHTHLAFEGYQFAKEQGLGESYTHRMFTAFFQEEQDIGDVEVLTRLATEVGLDAEAFRAALTNRTYREQHQRALRQAEQLGISAVPSFVIGNKLVRGLPREEDLARLIDAETRG
ncbi:DsbA family oxidoreductase [Hymenobacter sp. BT188]|uniref:DsbA family oxidoreductase n=1 Tax=Hymenobacter sp. BT188 TaxID=2763504 RepID=UPI00165165C5|nr:DsbA family oxidoreductase [Hymenobacter sp. BT188]MBC6606146.1 DsbA family oxidoreductase [Hymenobacter sp. BT188]